MYSGGADFIFIPERPPVTMPWEDNMCAEIHRVSDLGSSHPLSNPSLPLRSIVN